jgi:hypothetical protein
MLNISPSVAHVDYDISPLSRVKFNSLEWRNNLTLLSGEIS